MSLFSHTNVKSLLRPSIFLLCIPLLVGAYFMFTASKPIAVNQKEAKVAAAETQTKKSSEPASVPLQPLFIQPGTINALYLTGWLTSNDSKIENVIKAVSSTEMNAVVIDVKDFSGKVAFDTNVPEAKTYGAIHVKLPNVEALVQKLHKHGIYAIARIVVFQDSVLAEARPEIAVHSAATKEIWRDKNMLAWVDPASEDAWAYNVAIAKDALSRGFDEVNFDYVRFPSDGDTADMIFPVWDKTILRSAVIQGFFEYVRSQMPQAKLSIDLFGYTTTNHDDLGIGQVIEDAFPYFNYIDPMVYPSHYNSGFLSHDTPSEYPYEVVKYSLDSGLRRLKASGTAAKIRPWLQDFTLTVPYDAQKVQDEIRATLDAMGSDFAGFMLWNPANTYTFDALKR